MRIVIIEDELPAANRLVKMLQALPYETDIIRRIDSVESAVKYFNTSPEVDLIFMDIQLADGLSFDIFQHTAITAPVIFTTAFDQYTLKAFKVNSIDYLLKPIDEKELEQVVEKYVNLFKQIHANFSDNILKLVQELNAARYRERFLIKRGKQLGYLKTDTTAYCYADGKLCYAFDFSGNKFLLDVNLSQLENELHPQKFYRINRHLMVHIDAIQKVHTWLGGRLKLDLLPVSTADTVVSRERVNGFKEWLGR